MAVAVFAAPSQIDIAVQLFQTTGYPDDDFPAYALVSTRRDVEEVASFVGID